MDIQSTKLEIIKFLLNSNKESVLSKFISIIDKENIEKIVSHSIDGRPLTMEQYHAELKEAEEEIEKGDFLTSEDLEKEIASWK